MTDDGTRFDPWNPFYRRLPLLIAIDRDRWPLLFISVGVTMFAPLGILPLLTPPIVLFGLGLVIGVLSGLLGIGGGLLAVPSLTALGFGLHFATATSLMGVLLSSVSGSMRNWRAGELDGRQSLGLAIGGIPAAQLGAIVGEQLATPTLAFAFAGLQFGVMYLMSLRQRLQRDRPLDDPDRDADTRHPLDSTTAIAARRSQFRSWFRFWFSSWFRWPAVGIGLIAGILAGVFGVGGGVVMVPLQVLVLNVSVKAAVRASLGAIGAIAASGLVRHAMLGNVLWIPGLCLGAGGVVGAQLGARVLPRLPERRVSALFRGLLVVVAIAMIFEGWQALD